jgi:hypothetical protein
VDDDVETAEQVATAPAEPEPEPISVDEILDVHLYLKNFQGTLTDLLSQPHRSR